MTPPRRACLPSGARKKISVRTALTHTAQGDRRGQEPPPSDHSQHRDRPHFIFPFFTHQGATLGLPPGTLLPRVGEAIADLAAGLPSPQVFFLSVTHREGNMLITAGQGFLLGPQEEAAASTATGLFPRKRSPGACRAPGTASTALLSQQLWWDTRGSSTRLPPRTFTPRESQTGCELGTGPCFYKHCRFELTSTHRDVFETWVPPAGFAAPTAAGPGHLQQTESDQEKRVTEHTTGNFCCSEMEKTELIAEPVLPVRDKMQ